jgi:Holliday junction resolvase
MTESQIQSKLIKHFESKGFYVIKLIKTSVNGIPDLLVIKEDRVKFIEVKKPGGKIAKLQEFRIRELRQQGIDAVVMDGIDSVIY